MTNEIKINIPVTEADFKKAGDKMAFNIGLNLTIGGQVTVSSGAVDAIAEAVAGSTGGATFWDTSENATTLSNGATVNIGSNTYNASEGAINVTDVTQITTAIDKSIPADIYFVMKIASDTAYQLMNSTGSQALGNCVAGSSNTSLGNEPAGAAPYYKNGVAFSGTTQGELHTFYTTNSKIVVSLRGTQRPSFFNNLSRLLPGVAGAGNLLADVVIVDAQDDAGADAIEAQLAARHGITL